MTTLKKVEARLAIMAAFSDDQIVALADRVLPVFKSLEAEGYGSYPQLYLVPPKSQKDRLRDLRHSAHYARLAGIGVRIVTKLLQAIVDVQAHPADRAAQINRALQECGEYGTDLPKNVTKLASWLVSTCQKLQDKELSPEGKKVKKALTTNPEVKLLVKSWPSIIKLAKQEVTELNDTHKLLQSGGTRLEIWNNLKRVPELRGWKFTKEKTPYRTVDLLATSPDGLNQIEVGFGYEGAYALIPRFKIDGKDTTWLSWARRGIDSGEESFKNSQNLNYAVRSLLQKIQTAREKRLELMSSGVEYNLGPRIIKLLPKAMDEIIQRLKKTGVWELPPHGFGIGYRFSTQRRYPDSKPAAQWLSDDVGRLVYYTQYDAD